jgi:hypothetical protein
MIERLPLLLTLSDLERLHSIFKTFWYRDTDQTASVTQEHARGLRRRSL